MKMTNQFFTPEQKEMMLELFRVFAPTFNEKPVIEIVEKRLQKLGIAYTKDENGNIFNFDNPGMPMLSAHMDCVGDSTDGFYIAFTNIIPYGNDEILKGMGNIGGDDKCGVFLILVMLEEIPNLNFCFSVEEERGGTKGIKSMKNLPDSNKVPYAFVLDRRFGGDIICVNNNYGTKEFENELADIGKDFGYKPATGSFSDANTISEYMSCANLSVGYYNPHSKKEFASLSEMANTKKYMMTLIEKLQGKDFDTPIKTPVYTGTTHVVKYSQAPADPSTWCTDCKFYVKNIDYDFQKKKCKNCADKDDKKNIITEHYGAYGQYGYD